MGNHYAQAEKLYSIYLVIQHLFFLFSSTFRVFSDGGNFSTDEIDEYRKRLVK